VATILTVDDAVRTRVLAKMKKWDKQIKAEVLKEAKKQSTFVRGVKSITFSRLTLPTKRVLDLDLGALSIDDKQAGIVVYGEEYDNGSDTEDSTVFKYEKVLTHSWHWELTAGVTFTYTAEANLPELASLSNTLEVSFSATYGETGLESNTYTWERTIGLQPRHKTVISAVLTQVAGTVPFTCRLIVDGNIECSGNFDVKVFPDVTQDFAIPLQRLLTPKERTFTTTGVLVGASGLQALVKKNVTPLSPKALKQVGNRIARNVLHDGMLERGVSLRLK
jgi:hypothetical protein